MCTLISCEVYFSDLNILSDKMNVVTLTNLLPLYGEYADVPYGLIVEIELISSHTKILHCNGQTEVYPTKYSPNLSTLVSV